LLDWSGSLSLPTTPHCSSCPLFFLTSSLHIDYSDCRVLFVKCSVICTSRKVTICSTSKVEHPLIGIMQIVFHSYCTRQSLSKHLAGSHRKNTSYDFLPTCIYLQWNFLKQHPCFGRCMKNLIFFILCLHSFLFCSVLCSSIKMVLMYYTDLQSQ
jgi:hypothetical protein